MKTEPKTAAKIITQPRAAEWQTPPQEERRRRYEAIAREECGGRYVSVRLVKDMPEGIPATASGCAQWTGTHYEILLSVVFFDNDQNASYELETVGEEIAHLITADPIKKRPEEITAARIAHRALPRDERLAITNEMEKSAKRRGAALVWKWRTTGKVNW